MSADKRRDWVRSFLDGDRSHVKFAAISDYLDELIQSPADFLEVLASVRYIDRHLVIEAVRPRLPDLLQSAYDLILTVQMVKPEKHASIFDWVQCHDVGQWINSLSDLNSLLKWIDIDHSRVVIESLREGQLEELIERAYESELRTAYDKERPRASKHLLQVLQLVGDDNNRLVLEAVKSSLDKWITSINDFNLILGFIPKEDKKWLLDLLWSDKRIEQWVHSASDFSLVSKFLPTEFSIKLFEKFKSKINGSINSIVDFEQVMKYLPGDATLLRAEVFEMVGSRVEEWIQSAADFEQVMQSLLRRDYKSRVAVLRVIRPRMGGLIHSAADLCMIVGCLYTTESRVEVLEMIRPRLGEVIQSAADFEYVMEYWAHDHILRAAVFDLVRPRLGELIHTAADFSQVVGRLFRDNRSRAAVSELVRPRLGELIGSAEDFEQIMGCLSWYTALHAAVFELVRPRLGELIHTAADFKLIMRYLPNELRAVVFEMVRPGLEELIHSAADFNLIIWHMPNESRAVVFEMVRPRLEELIHSAADFYLIMEHLPNELCAVLFEIVRPRLGELVHTAADFNLIMVHLPNESRAVVFEIVRPRLEELIHSAADFKLIIWHMPNESRAVVFEMVRSRLEELIHSAADFKLITMGLSRDATKTVFELIKPRLNDLIQCHSDLCDIYCTLGGTERQDLLKQLSLDAERLRELVNGADGLIKLLKCVHHDGVISILRIFKKIFPAGLSYTKENLQHALASFHIDYWVELLELFGGQPASWVAPVTQIYCSPGYVPFPRTTVTDNDRVRFLNLFWQKDPGIGETLISRPTFMRIMSDNIGEFSPKVQDGFRITNIKQRFQELSEGYKNLSSSRMHKTKKEVSDFLMQKTGELAEALIEKRCTDIRRLVQEIKQRIDEIRKDLRTQLMVFYGNPSRLGQVILDLQRLLNYPKPLFSKSRLTPLSIFSRGGAMSADDPAPEAEAEAKGPSSSAGGGGAA